MIVILAFFIGKVLFIRVASCKVLVLDSLEGVELRGHFLINFIFNEVRELLEIKETMTIAFVILLLIDEVVSVHQVLLHLLLLVFAHQLSQSAIELLNILGEKLSITKDLHE
jgi:hypothetical protein